MSTMQAKIIDSRGVPGRTKLARICTMAAVLWFFFYIFVYRYSWEYEFVAQFVVSDDLRVVVWRESGCDQVCVYKWDLIDGRNRLIRTEVLFGGDIGTYLEAFLKASDDKKWIGLFLDYDVPIGCCAIADASTGAKWDHFSDRQKYLEINDSLKVNIQGKPQSFFWGPFRPYPTAISH